ncbi:hypothetical protein, partial [Thalassovita sp.]|uniref:hypothetical protein n=1 Tax=Thalassovita sp. TaxID=1979401 RepID=UPI002B2681CB
SLVLLQDADNLIFAETASLHRLSPSSENRLTSNCGLFRGARQSRLEKLHIRSKPQKTKKFPRNC